MQTLETVLLILLIADALALGALILMQQGKGADIGAAFGAGGANTVFGATASSFMMKLTTWLAIGFFVITFGLAYAANQRAEGLQDLGMPDLPAPAPAVEAVEAPPELTAAEETVDSDVPEAPDS